MKIYIIIFLALVVAACSFKKEHDPKVTSATLRYWSIDKNVMLMTIRNDSLYNLMVENERLQQIRNLREDALQKINDLENELIVKHGGVNENGALLNSKNTIIVENYLIKDEYGKELQDLLNVFFESGLVEKKIANDSESIYHGLNEIKGKNFAELYFSNVNLYDALIQVAIFKLEMLKMEYDLIKSPGHP